MTKESSRVAIIGAGFSGLVSAYYLSRAGFKVDVYETSPRAGGLISTSAMPQGLVESAANAFLNSTLVEELFASIGVPQVGTKRVARRRYLYRAGRVHRWPLGWAGSWRVLVFLGKFIFNRASLRPAQQESIRDWGRRTLGVEASDFLLETALQGIYAGDPARLSASLILSRFFDQPSSIPAHPKLKPKIKGSVTAPNGMGQVIAGLVSYLQSSGVSLHFDTEPSISLALVKSARAKGGDTDHLHAVIVATNPIAAALLMREIDSAKADLLQKIELSPVISTTVFFKQTDPASQGFGVLFPPLENRKMLGVLKNDFIFEDRVNKCFSETWIMGGACRDITNWSDAEILQTIEAERREVFKISETPIASKITRWPKGIPHYTLELEEMLPALNDRSGRVLLFGNYLGDLGLAKILERASKLPGLLNSETL